MPAPRFDADAFLDAIESRDVDAFLEHFTEDAEFHGEDLPTPIRGREAERQLLESMMPAIEQLSVEPRVVVQEGDHVAILAHTSATYGSDVTLPMGGRTLRLAGKHVETNAALFLDLDDEGKITRIHRIRDTYTVMRELDIAPEEMEEIIEAVAAAPNP